jgi:hypothetical protein
MPASTEPTNLPLSGPAIRNARSQNERLCARCARINLDAVFSKPHRTRRGNLVKNLGPIARWRVDSCPFCHLLATTLPPSLSQRPEVKYSLRSSSSKKTPQMGWESVDTFMIWVEEWSVHHTPIFLIAQPEGQSAVRVLKESCIDFEILTN